MSIPRPARAARGFDERTPSVARMYDYYLGGHHNFAVDREAADRALAINPDFRLIMQANRAFLRRAVTFLVHQGLGQFLDLGSGIPTAGNVHEVAQALNPDTRVVYVDNDPVAVSHSASLLADNPNATVIEADARCTDDILNHPETRRLLDPRQPLAVLLVAFLHFIRDDDEALALVHRLRDAVAPGSYLAISHGVLDYQEAAAWRDQAVAVYERSSAPVALRPVTLIEGFFDGLELVEPGLVATPLWRPEGPDDVLLDEPKRANAVAGVGRKP